MEADFRAILAQDPAVAALASGRVGWGPRRQGSALPAVTLHRVSGAPSYVMEGPDGHAEARVQADIFAATHAGALALRDAVVLAVGGYRGTVGATSFQGVFVAREADFSDAGEADTDRLARISIDFIIHHRRA